jgi:hypothetical protein|tara:strand:- start:465 stop:770 length:306 start_codon:yes stop_codon:yes gene_type:complete
MAQKKLQKDSKYQALDLDGDGTVSDAELAVVEALETAEKMDAQRRMAWSALAIMALMTGLLFFVVSETRLKSISDLLGLAYIAFSGITCAYMGMSAYMSRK